MTTTLMKVSQACLRPAVSSLDECEDIEKSTGV